MMLANNSIETNSPINDKHCQGLRLLSFATERQNFAGFADQDTLKCIVKGLGLEASAEFDKPALETAAEFDESDLKAFADNAMLAKDFGKSWLRASAEFGKDSPETECKIAHDHHQQGDS